MSEIEKYKFLSHVGKTHVTVETSTVFAVLNPKP